MRKNTAKAKLAAGQIVTALSGADTADWIDRLGPLGIDAIWLEGEHGPVDFGPLGDLTRACDLWAMTSIVRVGQIEANTIYRVLDRGAQGIAVPHVNTADEARQVVDAAKFAPIGHRGMFVSRQGYGVSDYFHQANDQTMVVVLIEDVAALENLEKILEVDHIDVFHVAHHDLAQSMGYIGRADHPDVQRAVDQTITRIVAAGRTCGTSTDATTVGRFATAGVRFFYTHIQDWIRTGFSQYQSAATTGAAR